MDKPDIEVPQLPVPTRNETSLLPRRIDWALLNDPIFDLLDSHKQYRDALFSDEQVHWSKLRKTNSDALSKRECHEKIAEDLSSTNKAKLASIHLPIDANLLRSHLNQLRKQYQRINQKLGPVAASQPHEDFVPGSQVYTQLEQLTSQYPWWKRAHAHWRTNPSWNPIYQAPRLGAGDQQKVPDVREVRSARTKQEPVVIDVDELSDTVYIKRRATAGPADDSPRQSQRGRKRKSFPDEDTPTAGSSVPRGSSGNGAAANNHSHELEMAELTLKRQKLENDAIEKNAEARRLELEVEERRRIAETERAREKERHEFMMKLMEMAMPSKNPPAP